MSHTPLQQTPPTPQGPIAESAPDRTGNRALFWQIVAASVLGIGAGVAFPGLAKTLHWATDLFLRLIIFSVGPLLFSIVVLGITGAGSLRLVGRLGGRALLYFEAMTTLALLAAVAAAMIVRPGAGLHFVPNDADARLAASYAANAQTMHQGGISGFLLNIIPHTPVSAFASGNVLQILFTAVVAGCAMTAIGPQAAPARRLIEAIYAIFAQIMRYVIAIAPLGVFGAMATTTAQYGIGAIVHLFGFVALYCSAVGVFVLGILGVALRLSGLSPLQFWRYFRAEIVIVLTTTASDSVLPSVMAKLEALGCDRQVVGLVVPAGYSFNLDALSIYLGMAVIFLAQAADIPLGGWQIATVLATALLTSKGSHGVPGIAIVILAATLSAIPSVPPAGVVLLLAVDWFVGIARAGGNLCGNCVAPVVIAAWDGRLDRAQAARVLAAA